MADDPDKPQQQDDERQRLAQPVTGPFATGPIVAPSSVPSAVPASSTASAGDIPVIPPKSIGLSGTEPQSSTMQAPKVAGEKPSLAKRFEGDVAGLFHAKGRPEWEQQMSGLESRIAATNPADPTFPSLLMARRILEQDKPHSPLGGFGIRFAQNLGAQFAPQAARAQEARTGEQDRELQEAEQAQERSAAAKSQGELQQSEIEKNNAEAGKANREPVAKTQALGTPEEQAFASLLAKGVDPMDAYKQVKTTGATVPELDRPANPGEIDTLKQAVNDLPGLKPAEKAALTTWPEGVTPTTGNIKDRLAQIDRINQASATAGERATANAFRQLALGMEREKLDMEKAKGDEKQNQAFQKTIDRAQNANMDVNQPSPAGDYDLTMAFVDATKPSSGFRFTNTELQLIKGLRPVQGAAEAFAHGLTQGTFLSAGQREDMNMVIQRAAVQADQHLRGAGATTESRPQGASNIIKYDAQGNRINK